MTEALCEYMCVPEDKKELYHISAHLHDIGKIGVRDDILLKTEKLNDEEWDVMKSHPEKGFRILMTVPAFYDAALIVRSHHERYDGKGYPDGLAGNQIPPGARIIAVADSIDAMLSDRPYRKGMTSEACREQIKKNIGTMYDPIVAQAALDHWDDLLLSRDRENACCGIVTSERS